MRVDFGGVLLSDGNFLLVRHRAGEATRQSAIAVIFRGFMCFGELQSSAEPGTSSAGRKDSARTRTEELHGTNARRNHKSIGFDDVAATSVVTENGVSVTVRSVVCAHPCQFFLGRRDDADAVVLHL